ncbi:hypothetical protein ES702_06350 [subsurface metagenome]
MTKSKEEIIKAVDNLQKRVEELEASGDPTDKADVKKYMEALNEIAELKTKIQKLEDKAEPKPKDEDFGEDW